MFQDYDEEILCSILFEQNNGSLDASIETILRMQQDGNTNNQTANQTKENAEAAKEPEGSSLVADEPDAKTQEEAAAKQGEEGGKAEVDADT